MLGPVVPGPQEVHVPEFGPGLHHAIDVTIGFGDPVCLVQCGEALLVQATD